MMTQHQFFWPAFTLSQVCLSAKPEPDALNGHNVKSCPSSEYHGTPDCHFEIFEHQAPGKQKLNFIELIGKIGNTDKMFLFNLFNINRI